MLLFLLVASPLLAGERFQSHWPDPGVRIWVGPEYWANPMEDWQVSAGRLECLRGGVNRNVHVLTRQIGPGPGGFEMSVATGRLEGENGSGSTGFRIGIMDDLRDYRGSLFRGAGLDCGLTTEGALFIGQAHEDFPTLDGGLGKGVVLELKGVPKAGAFQLVLTASGLDGSRLASLEQTVSADQLEGNLALVNNHQAPPARKRAGSQKPGPGKGLVLGGKGKFWFKDWKISGAKIVSRPDQAFGPILWAQHTLSRGVLKLSAQMPPVGKADAQTVRLETRVGDGWKTVAEEAIHPLARTALFRIEKWNGANDTPYRLVYAFEGQDHVFAGTIRREPVDRAVVVAGFTGNTDYGFPNAKLVDNVLVQNPDVLVFTGDQIYEGVGGYGIHREPVELAALNYLRKFYMWGWAFRDLLKDRVSLLLPDDHDVYQGNIWGNGGNAVTMQNHQAGGFAMPPEWVNMVMRTQTAHHPDVHDPTPMKQGIDVFYGDMLYGRVGFAIVADRYFKSGPKGNTPPVGGRPDHVTKPSFDMKTLDVPGLTLLGDRQLAFLDHWAADWVGADMKMLLSQTIFANVANYHGAGKTYIEADLDSNGWPQTGRNKALRAIRRGFALHLAGDQHLASIVQHGVDTWGDAGYSFCVPSIAAGYPRAWRPKQPGRNAVKGMPYTGEYLDGLGNHITVYAVGNPEDQNRPGRLETLHDKASGHGIVRVDKARQTFTMECYRLLFDARKPEPRDQFPGWPKTIGLDENYGRPSIGNLTELNFQPLENPVVQVVKESDGEIVYTRRVVGTSFAPKVFEEGAYTVRIIGKGGTTELSRLRPVSR